MIAKTLKQILQAQQYRQQIFKEKFKLEQIPSDQQIGQLNQYYILNLIDIIRQENEKIQDSIKQKETDDQVSNFEIKIKEILKMIKNDYMKIQNDDQQIDNKTIGIYQSALNLISKAEFNLLKALNQLGEKKCLTKLINKYDDFINSNAIEFKRKLDLGKTLLQQTVHNKSNNMFSNYFDYYQEKINSNLEIIQGAYRSLKSYKSMIYSNQILPYVQDQKRQKMNFDSIFFNFQLNSRLIKIFLLSKKKLYFYFITAQSNLLVKFNWSISLGLDIILNLKEKNIDLTTQLSKLKVNSNTIFLNFNEEEFLTKLEVINGNDKVLEAQGQEDISFTLENFIALSDIQSSHENCKTQTVDQIYLTILKDLEQQQIEIKTSILEILDLNTPYKVKEFLVFNLIRLQQSVQEDCITQFSSKLLQYLWIFEKDQRVRSLLKNKELIEMQKQLFSSNLQLSADQIKQEMKQRINNLESLQQEIRLEGNLTIREQIKQKLEIAYEELDQYIDNLSEMSQKMEMNLQFLKDIQKDVKQIKTQMEIYKTVQIKQGMIQES